MRKFPNREPLAARSGKWPGCCVHTLGDTDIVDDLRLSAQGLESGVNALLAGCTVYTDTRMAAAGLPMRRLEPLGVTVTPLMALPGLAELAASRGTTRSRAGLALRKTWAATLWSSATRPQLFWAFWTCLRSGAQPPALIVGMPAGFVNAAQSKELLRQSSWPHFTLLGRKGGSAVAAACGTYLPPQRSRAELYSFIESELLELSDDPHMTEPRQNEYGRTDVDKMSDVAITLIFECRSVYSDT